MSAQHTPKPVPDLTVREMKIGSDIAIRFWEPRRGWEPAKAAESLRKEARRLHDQAMQVGRRPGELGGLPNVWRFTASMLAVEAEHLAAIAKAGSAS